MENGLVVDVMMTNLNGNAKTHPKSNKVPRNAVKEVSIISYKADNSLVCKEPMTWDWANWRC